MVAVWYNQAIANNRVLLEKSKKWKNKNALCAAENANMYLFQMIQILIDSAQNPVENLITGKLWNVSMILYQDDFLFVREDMALGISVYSKNPYARIKIYGMSKEQALQTFHKEYNDILECVKKDLQEQEMAGFSKGEKYENFNG